MTVTTVHYGNHITDYTGLETCEGCGKLHSDQIIPCHDLGLCPTCQTDGQYKACSTCDCTMHPDKHLIHQIGSNAYQCDRCHDYDSQPFEMDWQGHD
jgi:hypothetical protein